MSTIKVDYPISDIRYKSHAKIYTGIMRIMHKIETKTDNNYNSIRDWN